MTRKKKKTAKPGPYMQYYEDLCAARERKATESELAEIRAQFLRQNGGGQEYAHAWIPPVVSPPEEEPVRKIINPGRTTERRGDLF